MVCKMEWIIFQGPSFLIDKKYNFDLDKIGEIIHYEKVNKKFPLTVPSSTREQVQVRPLPIIKQEKCKPPTYRVWVWRWHPK